MKVHVLHRVAVRFKDEEKIRWITVNGAHIPVGNDGDLKGEAGYKIEKNEGGRPKKVQEPKKFPKSGVDLTANPPTKDTGAYLERAGGNASKAVAAYYDKELRGGFVKTKLEVNDKDIPAEVLFDGNGRREFRKFQGNQEDILAVLPYIPEVIASGAYAGRVLDKKNHKNQIAFHYKKKRIKIDGAARTVIVDIGETKREDFHAYSVNTEGTYTFRVKNASFERRRRKRKIGDAALLPSSKDSACFIRGSQYLLRFLDSSIPRADETLKLSVLAIRVI